MSEKSIYQRRREFLDETVKFYGEDPQSRRSSNKLTCLYRTEDGRKCAIGRVIPDDKYDMRIENTTVMAIAHLERGEQVFQPGDVAALRDMIPDEYKELGYDFLGQVQYLHDDDRNWMTSGGLSGRGRVNVNEIIKEWCEPVGGEANE